FFASDDWLREHPPTIELTQLGSAYDIGVDHPLVRNFADAAGRATGSRPPVRGLESGADARLLVNYANTPTVIFGPGRLGNAHTVNEHLELDQFYAAVKILAIAIWRWCGGH
ncbi:MAG: M20/M25/M40 family metallo-hydrolase, partial [Planctomycetota bacterium]|nr:M20/M25/M40 family metallo-hydrolase [Planctomycetota bacterium]